MIDLISKCESMGHHVDVEGGHIKIENAVLLPDDLKAELIHCKSKLLESLNQDKQAHSIGVQIGIPGTLYFWTVSYSTTVYMEVTSIGWIAYSESYISGKKEANRFKVICEGNTFDYVFTKYKSYIDYIMQIRRKQ